MAEFRAFKGIRPQAGLAEKIASLPYDVMSRDEAKKMSERNECSFLHVARAEIDLDDSISPYDNSVYKQAGLNLKTMLEKGLLIEESLPVYYIYRQMMEGRIQTGIVGCASIDDYLNDIIKKHELTRVEKEIDRINNFDACNAHTEPVFLTYRKNGKLSGIIESWIKLHKPVYDFRSDDGISHVLWNVGDEHIVKAIHEIFCSIDYLYIADGHHRSASSVKVGLKRRDISSDYAGNEEFNYFPAVAFADDELFIMDYNRVVKDLNGYTNKQFLAGLQEKFHVMESLNRVRPIQKHTFGMYLEGSWYTLTAKDGSYDSSNIIESLDVSILQNNLLGPVLGIKDPRTDKRIDFVGGIRGLEELERRASGDMRVAFSLCPVTIRDLLAVADAGMIMPPKSTWFEPKLRSGLFVHGF